MASGSSDGNDELLKQAQNIWSMLDNMAHDSPDAYRRFIDKNINEGKEYMKWKNTPPEPHMCVQTKMLEPRGDTFYMNFCSWVRVPKPKSDEAPIPVFSSDIERVNANTSTVAVAFNPEVLAEFGRSAKILEEQKLLVNLAMDFVTDVHKVKISRTYSILPQSKLCYGEPSRAIQALRTKIGDRNDSFEKTMSDLKKDFAPLSSMSDESLMAQLSKMREGDEMEPSELGDKIVLPNNQPVKKGLIEEIPSADACESGNSSNNEIEEPGYTLKCVNCDSDSGQPRRLVLNVQLNGVRSVSECQLDLTKTDVLLVVKNRYRLSLRLPESVRDDLSRAKFSKKTSTLTVTLPTLS